MLPSDKEYITVYEIYFYWGLGLKSNRDANVSQYSTVSLPFVSIWIGWTVTENLTFYHPRAFSYIIVGRIYKHMNTTATGYLLRGAVNYTEMPYVLSRLILNE